MNVLEEVNGNDLLGEPVWERKSSRLGHRLEMVAAPIGVDMDVARQWEWATAQLDLRLPTVFSSKPRRRLATAGR